MLNMSFLIPVKKTLYNSAGFFFECQEIGRAQVEYRTIVLNPQELIIEVRYITCTMNQSTYSASQTGHLSILDWSRASRTSMFTYRA